ncbi:MAG: BatD family protein [Gemmatimonadota bacterium]
MTARLAGRVLGLALALVVAVPAAGAAQDVAVRAYLSPDGAVGVGRPFVVNVEVTGAQSVAEQPDLPDLGAFAQYLGSSTQSSMQMVNGRTSVSLTLQYRFQALREGTYDIPAFDVPVGGRTLRTEPLRLTVSASPPPQSGGQAGGGQGGAAAPGVGATDLFITAEASRSRVREGEPFVVEYRIWTLLDVSSFNFTRIPEPQGFWVEDITPQGQPQVEQLVRNGQRYTTAVIRRVALVPTGSGERTLEPLGLEVQVRVRREDPFGGFFGRSPFGTAVVPTSVLSNPVTIAVEALPPGRPEPFSGIVGSLSLSASLDRDSIATGDAVTLTLRASGEGNVRGIPSPVLGLPADFETFPPEVDETVRPFGPGLTGEKTFTYVLIPRAPGAREIPPITMGFFDGAAGAYRTATTEGLGLTVTGTALGGPGLTGRGGVAQLREDIRFIRLGDPGLRPVGRNLLGSAGFWIFALLPVAGIGGAVALRRHRDLLEGDVAYARGRRASRVARKRLAQARGLAAVTDTRAFYAEVARALRGLVADRMNVAEAGLLTADLDARLAGRGVEAGVSAEVRACLDHCDRQRFAPPGTDPEEKARFLERVGDVMTRLDKALRS